MSDAHHLVLDHTIYSCVVGSQAYGLAGPDSDVDRRGVFLAPHTYVLGPEEAAIAMGATTR